VALYWLSIGSLLALYWLSIGSLLALYWLSIGSRNTGTLHDGEPLRHDASG
jgi:hypothetical protein